MIFIGPLGMGLGHNGTNPQLLLTIYFVESNYFSTILNKIN